MTSLSPPPVSENLLIIEGGRPLEGSVTVSGAKNAVLKLMAAALLAEEPSTFYNVPRITDVFTMAEVLEHIGARVTFIGNTLTVDPSGTLQPETPYELVRRMRASVTVMGPLVARLGQAHVALPGGCNLGPRKIDLHLMGLKSLGAKVSVGHGLLSVQAATLIGKRIVLEYPSVGATENLMMAGVRAKGVTTIENAAREPEIVDTAKFLMSMGARVKGAGTPTITVEGVKRLSGASHTVIGDRMEAATYLIAGLLSGGEVRVAGINPVYLEMLTGKLRAMGAYVEEGSNYLIGRMGARARSVDISTLPHPGFATDLQPLIAVLLTQAHGISILTENVFESRFVYVDELIRLGAHITTKGHHAIIHGPTPLSGATCQAPDLRGGAALLLAGLAASGETRICATHHIDRGYEAYEAKLTSLGARLRRSHKKTDSSHVAATA